MVLYCDFRSLALFGFVGLLNKAAKIKYIATLLSAAKLWPLLLPEGSLQGFPKIKGATFRVQDTTPGEALLEVLWI